MSKQPGMDDQKVLEKLYITGETLYKTYMRETNAVVKLSTRQMSTGHQTKKKVVDTSNVAGPSDEEEIVRKK
jgi:hypothetical protein